MSKIVWTTYEFSVSARRWARAAALLSAVNLLLLLVLLVLVA